MGDAFIQGLRYRLPLPVVHRSFGAYNPNNLIPNSRINYLITYNRVVRVAMMRTTRFVLCLPDDDNRESLRLFRILLLPLFATFIHTL